MRERDGERTLGLRESRARSLNLGGAGPPRETNENGSVARLRARFLRECEDGVITD